MAAVQADIHDRIADEKRFVVFNSRRLTGECCKYNNGACRFILSVLPRVLVDGGGYFLAIVSPHIGMMTTTTKYPHAYQILSVSDSLT